MKWDSKTIVAVAIFFLLPLQTVFLLREPIIDGEKWQYGMIGAYLTDVLLFLALCMAAARLLRKTGKFQRKAADATEGNPRRSKRVNPGTAILVAFLMWVGLSVFWAHDPWLASYFLAKLLLAVGAFSIAWGLDGRGRKAAMVAIIAAAVIQSVFGVIQFLTQEVPASTILGMSAHEPVEAGASVLKFEFERYLRAYGTLPHPNMLGGFLMVAILFGLVLAEQVKTRRGELMVFTAFPIIVLGLILTFSRAAWLGATMGIVAYGAQSIVRWAREKRGAEDDDVPSFPARRNWWTFVQARAILAIVLSALIFTAIFHEQVFPRFDGVSIKREGSVSERVASLRDARTLIAEHSLFGVGAGNFTAAIIEKEPDRPIWSIQPAHNVFVLVFAELGLVGLLLFGGFLFAVFQSTIFNRQYSILLALLPILLLDHWLWSSHFGLLLFFVFLGLVSRK